MKNATSHTPLKKSVHVLFVVIKQMCEHAGRAVHVPIGTGMSPGSKDALVMRSPTRPSAGADGEAEVCRRRLPARTTASTSALCLSPMVENKTAQRIPRVIRQTHTLAYCMLPYRMRYWSLTWPRLNPEYTYCYYSDEAMAEYVRRHGSAEAGFLDAFRRAPHGSIRCDLWRALVTWREGGVYVDMDSVAKHPLRKYILPEDDAVSGLTDVYHGLEQHILAYSPRHPVLHRLVRSAVAEVLHRNYSELADPLEVSHVAGPRRLKRVAEELFGVSTSGEQFSPGVYSVAAAPGNASRRHRRGVSRSRKLRILHANYSCAGCDKWCGCRDNCIPALPPPTHE